MSQISSQMSTTEQQTSIVPPTFNLNQYLPPDSFKRDDTNDNFKSSKSSIYLKKKKLCSSTSNLQSLSKKKSKSDVDVSNAAASKSSTSGSQLCRPNASSSSLHSPSHLQPPLSFQYKTRQLKVPAQTMPLPPLLAMTRSPQQQPRTNHRNLYRIDCVHKTCPTGITFPNWRLTIVLTKCCVEVAKAD